MARHFMYAEVLVFALSMALIMYYYENYPENIKPAYRGLLKKFFGVNWTAASLMTYHESSYFNQLEKDDTT